MKKILFHFCLLFLFISISLPSRGKDVFSSDSLQISLITSGPGNDLYTAFGHTAIRVQDFSSGGDFVFNYGTFDFSTDHFYWKFTRGRLMYFLSVQKFPLFLQAYKAEGRKLTEQILNLSKAEKHHIFNYLRVNYKPENRFYKYNFLSDNCATRIRDIIGDSYGKSWKIDNIIPEKGLSFRDIINAYLDNSPWERLGINLMFGKRADEAMTNKEIMFLPKYLMVGFQHSSINGHSLVKTKKILNNPHSEKAPYPFYLRPIFWFSLLCLFILILSFSKSNKFSNKLLPWIDRCLFFLSGLLGCFLVFMWFGTDHGITKWNYNILWLFPVNIFFSFHFFKDKKWVKTYAIFIVAVNLILLATFLILPQELPFALLPFMAVLGVRALKIISRFNKVHE